MHLFYSLAHRIRKIWWHVRRPQTLGVKVLLRNGDSDVLLVKPVYNTTWQLPGGGVNRFEHPMHAAARELHEETGIDIDPGELTLVDVFTNTHEGKSDLVVLYSGHADTMPQVDGREIAQADFFPADSLPGNVGASVHRRLTGRSANGRW